MCMFFICFLNDERDLLSLVFCESSPHNSGPLQIKLFVIICVLRATRSVHEGLYDILCSGHEHHSS